MYIFNSAVLTSTKITFMLFFVFVLVNSVSGEKRFNLQRYCRSQCNIGKGGNLCRCNAFHFAGKRADFVSHGLRTSSESMSQSRSKNLPTESASRKFLNDIPSDQLIPSDGDEELSEDGVPSGVPGKGSRDRFTVRKTAALLKKLIDLLRKERNIRA